MRGSRGCRREGHGEGGKYTPEYTSIQEDRSRGSLPAAAENDDTGFSLSRRVGIHGVSSCREPIKRERLENFASPVSLGWKPDRKVAGEMVEFHDRGNQRWEAADHEVYNILYTEFLNCRYFTPRIRDTLTREKKE